MSRIGKSPVQIPEKVSVEINGLTITVKGPKGELKRIMPEGVNFDQKENQIILSLRRKQAEQRLSLDRDLLQRLEKLVTVGAIEETQILEKEAEIDKLEISLESLKSEQKRTKAQSNQKLIEINQIIRELEAKKERFKVKSPITGFVQELRHQRCISF